jgi:hypothetical protein
MKNDCDKMKGEWAEKLIVFSPTAAGFILTPDVSFRPITEWLGA